MSRVEASTVRNLSWAANPSRAATSLRILVAATGIGYLLWGTRNGLSGLEVSVAIGSIGLVPLAGRLPTFVAVMQALLLGSAELWAPAVATVPKVALAAALIEIVIATGRRTVVLTALTGAFAYAVTGLAGDPGPTFGQIFFRVLIGVVGPLLVGAYLKAIEQERRTAAQLAADAESRRFMAESIVRQTERATIARELHDVVAHHVTSMLLRVSVAQRVLPHDERTAEVLADVHSSATLALADTKQLLRRLRTDTTPDLDDRIVNPAELPAAVQRVAARLRDAGRETDVCITADLTDVDALTALTALRVAQEAMTNAARHGVGRIDVRISGAGPEPLTVSVQNAVDDRRPQNRNGFGILGMKERVDVVGGTLTSGIVEDRWVIRASIPRAGGVKT